MLGLQECDVRGVPDGLFLERLEAFMERSLVDMRAFARRENRPVEEIRRYVAEWHSKYLFKHDEPGIATTTKDGDGQVRSVLCDTSRVLESLWQVSGTHSFLLAVDPSDPVDQGFLGGTVAGREFWRGLRGGGELGARNFKMHCLKETGPTSDTVHVDDPAPTLPAIPTFVSKQTPTNALKTEIYANVRSALRTASGIRNAEMKWTNHDRLSVYGVRIVGWPHGIPLQNPSSLSSSQNRRLLERLKNGSLHFVRTADRLEESVGSPATTGSVHTGSSTEGGDDLSWAYEDSNC